MHRKDFAPPRIDTKALDEFLARNDFCDLYRRYSWENDSHKRGFPDILKLEKRISGKVKAGLPLTLWDVRAVVAWGSPGRKNRFSSLVTFKGRARGKGKFIIDFDADAAPPVSKEEVVCGLIGYIKYFLSGVGPTYASKILRFADPVNFGAIDTTLVRVFGEGDPAVQKHKWLALRVTGNWHCGHYIKENVRSWPRDYARWLDILGYFGRSLNAAGVRCPHPRLFVREGLRRAGRWVCADVEMALWSYATDVIYNTI